VNQVHAQSLLDSNHAIDSNQAIRVMPSIRIGSS
jgi:hypothetical protein